jgi:hypothetical protein
MDRARIIVGSGLLLIFALSTTYAWSQTAPNDPQGRCDKVAYASPSFGAASASVMDLNLSQNIKRAWSEGKNATAAMAFQENGEIAMSERKDREAKQYFGQAEREFATLQLEEPGD